MKKVIFTLLSAAIVFSSCQKDSVAPKVTTTTTTKTATTTTPVLNSTVAAPVLPVNISGILRVQLNKDSINTDNVLIAFKPGASAAYVKNEDAITLQGFGMVSLSSFSSDGIGLAINVEPLVKTVTTVGLKVNAQADGTYNLKLQSLTGLPSTYEVWLKDNYAKDSLDFKNNKNYAFNIAAADTATYGSHRFSIVVHAK